MGGKMIDFKTFLVEKNDPCWDGYQMIGWKKKDGKKVPNCVPMKEGSKPCCDNCGPVNAWGEVSEDSEYQGKKVKLNDPMKGDVKKYKVYVKNSKGNVVKVNFGDPNMEIKRDDPARRKSFRARHKCDQKKDKTTAGYWSCKFWSKTSLTDLMK